MIYCQKGMINGPWQYWLVVTALLCIAACCQQPPPQQPHPDYGSIALMDTLASNGYWFTVIPPESAYAADRNYVFGGPVASAPMEGAESHGASYVYSTNQLDENAPLKKWRKIGYFPSEQECEDQKAKDLKKISDPSWLATQALKMRTRIIDASRIRDVAIAERCVKATELQ